jgi:hypothetical protein
VTDKYESPDLGPYDTKQVNHIETVCLKVNAVENTSNIRSIIPFYEVPDSDDGEECNIGILKRKGSIINEVLNPQLQIRYH